jgi:hypothetical protein
MPDLKYGPQTEAVLALVERAGRLTLGELTALADAWAASEAVWSAAGYVPWAVGHAFVAATGSAARASGDAAGDAAWSAARAARVTGDAATWAAIWAAAWTAAFALALRGELDQASYNILTRAWALVVGPVHPDDPDRRGSDA